MAEENAAESSPDPKFDRNVFLYELALLLVVALFYAGSLFNMDPSALQQTGEQNESSTLPILVARSIRIYGEYPRWNPYMLTGFPHSGDPLTQFLNPFALIPVVVLGGIPGMKASVFIAFFLAGVGQLLLGYVLNFKLVTRLWTALLFMLSGGLAMLWRIGWVGLLVGVAWFPFCVAFVLWALDSKKRYPIGLAAIAICLLFISGSAYWFLYFIGSLMVIVAFKLIAARIESKSWESTRRMVYRLLLVGLLSAGLAAASLLPMTDAWANASKASGPEVVQRGSQPIAEALFNYVTSDLGYYQADIFGKIASGSWMYIGALPFVFLLFVPLAYTKSDRKSAILLIATLAIFLLAWQANQHNPIGWLYEKIPFLYQFRLPNRILIVAASPLIALAGFGLSYLFEQSGKVEGAIAYLPSRGNDRIERRVSFKSLIEFGLVLTLAYATYGVYQTNKSFAFAPSTLDATAEKTLTWLRKYDPSVYYINIGNWPIIWSWMPAAYQNEHMVINFDYGRTLQSWEHQNDPETPLRATPKYIIADSGNPPDSAFKIVNSVNTINVYYMLDSLPFAFVVPKAEIASGETITPEMVEGLNPRFDGPNRIVVQVSAQDKDSYVVALESYYPGWKVRVDGEPATLLKVGDYLGVQTQSGNHEYVFSFEPAKFTWGILISLIFIVGVVLYMLSDRYNYLTIFRKRVAKGRDSVKE